MFVSLLFYSLPSFLIIFAITLGMRLRANGVDTHGGVQNADRKRFWNSIAYTVVPPYPQEIQSRSLSGC